MEGVRMSEISKYIHDLEIQAAELFIEKSKMEERAAIAERALYDVKKDLKKTKKKCKNYENRKAVRFSNKVNKIKKRLSGKI